MKDNVVVKQAGRSTPWLILAAVGLAVAKVAGYLTIPWWLVLAPVWAPWAIVLIFLLVLAVGIGALFGGAVTLDAFNDWKRGRTLKRKYA